MDYEHEHEHIVIARFRDKNVVIARFRDKTAYVWGLRYQRDPSLSRNPVPRFPHFMPPCWVVQSNFSTSLFLTKDPLFSIIMDFTMIV